MKSIFLSTFLLLFICSLFGQTDTKAKTILDQTSKKNNAYKTISVDFKFQTTSLQTDKTVHEAGKITIKGDKYHLILSNSEVICDGKSVYTYLKESNEVNITKPEPAKKNNGDFFFSNPKDLFTIYNKDFKSKYISETSAGGISCHEIDLYPNDLKTKYTKIKAFIDKTSLQIVSVKVFQKDGTQYVLELSNFSGNLEIKDADFTFDKKKYPKAEINDMRF